MDLLRCPVCLATFNDPQLLPACGHTFCRGCVEGVLGNATLIKGARCPTCRRQFRAGDMRPNFALRQLLADTATAGQWAGELVEEAPSENANVPTGSCARDPVQQSAANRHLKRLVFAGVPYGLARLISEEDAQIGLRIFVLDNSGSTSACDGHYFKNEGHQLKSVRCSRWEEIKAMAMEHADWNIAFGVPCEFMLLNPGPGPRQDGRDVVRIDPSRADLPMEQQVGMLRQMLDRSGPAGPTPLAQRVTEIHQRVRGDLPELSSKGQKVVLILVTDGVPSDPHGYGESSGAMDGLGRCLKKLMMELPVYVVIRLVTDDDKVLSYYSNMDKELELNLEVLDDLASEAKEIREQGNGWLTYTPLLHRIREGGTFLKLLDLLDERRLTPMEISVMVQLLMRGDGEPPFPSDPKQFMEVLKARVPQEALVYDPIRRRMAPIIDVQRVSWEVLGVWQPLLEHVHAFIHFVLALIRACIDRLKVPPRPVQHTHAN